MRKIIYYLGWIIMIMKTVIITAETITNTLTIINRIFSGTCFIKS